MAKQLNQDISLYSRVEFPFFVLYSGYMAKKKVAPKSKTKDMLFPALAAALVLATALVDPAISGVVSLTLLVGCLGYILFYKKNHKLFVGYGKIILVALLAAVFFVFVIRFFSGEDDWICSRGQWIKHGNPSSQAPTRPCK